LERAMTGEHDAEDPDAPPMQEEVSYHEFVVLDSAGRLQIPKEVREQFGIGKRAELEVTEEGIVIHPTKEDAEAAAKPLSLEEQIGLLFETESAPPKKPRSQRRLRLPGRKRDTR
jgi:AbrB family looped-hinge helix DNA binding protein